MTDFERVNGGIAFSGPFTVENAEDLRTNGELLWKMGALRFVGARIDSDALGASTTGLSIGPFCWSEIDGNYVMCAGNTDTANDSLIVTLAPGGLPIAKTAAYSATTDSTLVWLFSSAATGFYYLVTTDGISAFSEMTLGTPLDIFTFPSTFTPSGTDGPLVIASSAQSVTFALNGTGAGVSLNKILIVTHAYDSGSSSYEFTTDLGDGGGSYLAASNSLLISAGDLTYDITGGSFNAADFSSKRNAAADYGERVAYDARLSRFVRFSNGDPAGAYPSNLMWSTSSDGITWSATVGWKRFAPPWSSDTILDSFVITDDGMWVAFCSVVIGANSTALYALSSIDGGSNWQVIPLAITPPLQASRFVASAAGPTVVAIAIENTGIVQHVFSGGWHTSGTEIASVNL